MTSGASSPFEPIAARYATLWSDTPRGRAQRAEVWMEVDPFFRRGDRILDLGCGPGDDAVHLESRGVSVLGIDAAPGMVEIARSRDIEARVMAIENLAALGGTFDGALSNFGALNCVANLGAVSEALARLIRPQGKFAVCVLSRFCWRCDWRHLVRRWSGHTRWRGMDVYYRSGAAVTRAFVPHFKLLRRVSIGQGDHLLLIFARRPEC